MTLRIALLGQLMVEVNGEPLRVDTRKAVALLAYLAEAGASVPRDTLGLLLWPDAPRDRSRAVLRRTLSALRKGLADDWIESDRVQVALRDAPGLFVDVQRFQVLAGSDDLESLSEAAGLYRGEFMAGFGIGGSPEFDDWLVGRSAAYRRLAASAFQRLSEAQAARGAHGDAIAAAARWLELDPLHEPAHRRLMWLHAAAGDRASALRQYRDCVRILEDELGVMPLEETVALHRSVAEGTVAPLRPLPATDDRVGARLAEAPSFVGRQDSLATLAEAHSRASRGLSVVVVTGEPGIGKTRLVEEFGRGLPMIAARGHPGERALAYGLAGEIVTSALRLEGVPERLGRMPAWWLVEAARLAPELADRLPGSTTPSRVDSPGDQRRLLEGVGRLVLGLGAARPPGVLFLDDFQWADDESAEMVGFWVRRLQDHPVLMIVGARSGTETGGPPAPLIRDAASSGILTTLELPRLGEAQTRMLVESIRPEVVRHTGELFRLSEGVPFFVIEYLAAMDPEGEQLEPLTAGGRNLLAERIDGVSDLGRQIATSASVIGRSFDFDVLASASGRSLEEALMGLEELQSKGLVRQVADTSGFDFAHDRLRQFVYESIGALRRRILHGRVADALLVTSRPPDPKLATRVAGHLEAAGRHAEAAEQYLVAGDHAAGLYANEHAMRLYEAALALGHPDTSRIRGAIGRLQSLSGDYGTALASLETAAASAPASRVGGIEHEIAVVHARAGEWSLAETRFAAAAEALTDPSARSRLMADWAVAAYRRGEVERARALAGRALTEARQGEDPLALAEAYNVLGILERRDDPEAARRHHETSLELVRDADPSVRAAALNNLALAHLAGGRPVDGLESAMQALEIAERIGDRHIEAAVHSNLADLLHADRREEEAMEHLKHSAALFVEVGMSPGSLEPEVWMLTEW